MIAASRNQNSEVITILLQAGADIKARDKNGITALMIAARDNQDPEVITTLLKTGADAKAKDNAGNTAFDYAHLNWKLYSTGMLDKLEEAPK